jgi:hypothetical protein
VSVAVTVIPAAALAEAAAVAAAAVALGQAVGPDRMAAHRQAAQAEITLPGRDRARVGPVRMGQPGLSAVAAAVRAA